MDDRTVGRFWDDNAPGWIEAVRAGYDLYRLYVNNPVFFSMLGDIDGAKTLDVGCGEGFNTRLLADMGADVVGVDISQRMIDAAREHERTEPRNITYHTTSGADMRMLEDATFDAVVSTMALMDMSDYAGCIHEVSRVLRAAGTLQFSITHPCMFTRTWEWHTDDDGQRRGVLTGNYYGLLAHDPADDIEQWYFSAAPESMRQRHGLFNVPRFHRTLSEYVNTLTESGFIITRMEEPCADDATIAEHPELADTRIVPYFLIIQCRKW